MGLRRLRSDNIHTAGIDGSVPDAAPADPTAVDALSPPSDARTEVRDAGGPEPPIAVDPVAFVADARLAVTIEPSARASSRDHWAFTSPTRIKRSQDLPLRLCPEVEPAGA